MPDKPPKHVVDYFRRGQLLFLVDGEWQGTADEEELLRWARPILEMKYPTLQIFIRNSVIFPSVEALLQGDEEGTHGGSEGQQTEPPPQPPDIEVIGPPLQISEEQRPYSSPSIRENGIFALVSAEIPQLASIPELKDSDRDKKLSDDASTLLEVIRDLDGERVSVLGGARLQVVSPNWLISITKDSQPGTTGGPGGRPTPYDGHADNQDYKIQPDDEDEWLRKILDIPEAQRGAGVVVAILDTAPTTEVVSPVPNAKWVMKRANEKGSFLEAMYKKWVIDRDKPPRDPADQHPLVKRLLNPEDPRLTVYLNPDVDREDLKIDPDGYIQADKHDYYMTDHGLFVAGLIHSLAPQAELHLYQVLNRYGVGDLESIADALLDVYTRFADKPGDKRLAGVNMSVTFNMPREEDDEEGDEMGKSLRAYGKQEKSDVNSWFARQKRPGERICDLAYQIGSRIIAAAGNNRKGPEHARPEASFPAALDSVLGVGALAKAKNPPSDATEKLETASYSNRADRPGYVGITTLGGEPGKGKGVLGIYVAEFPETQDDHKGGADKKGLSQNGWGWWAGTSFATPIITGITAALLASMPPEKKTEDAIQRLFGGQHFETKDREDVLFVTQGPSSL